MDEKNPKNEITFDDAVRNAAKRPAVRAVVRNVYCALQEEIDRRRPICKTSGRCCRFDEYGHRLYVTTAEMAVFVSELPSIDSGRRCVTAVTRSLPIFKEPSCPFQVDGLCSVHAIRPFGCRVFFCDETATDWQRAQYELFHRKLKEIHLCMDIPYFYVEWRQALATLGLDRKL